MMAEAKKMMDSPEFKKQMKQFEKSKEFKDAAKKTEEMMKDPQTAARMAAQAEHMVKRGQDQMKKTAQASIADAFGALNDPKMMAEAQKMMKDPKFIQNFQKMATDPNFKPYMEAVSSMMLSISLFFFNYDLASF